MLRGARAIWLRPPASSIPRRRRLASSLPDTLNAGAGLLVAGAGSSPDRTGRLGQAAGRHLGVGHVADPDRVDRLALPWLVFLVPGLFARDVVDHAFESECLEPPRGSGRQVSAEVVAVDENR